MTTATSSGFSPAGAEAVAGFELPTATTQTGAETLAAAGVTDFGFKTAFKTAGEAPLFLSATRPLAEVSKWCDFAVPMTSKMT